jgi:hypothetical protein
MNNSGTIHTMRFRRMNDECRQIRMRLPDELLTKPDGLISSGLLQHVSHCRSCLEVFIALQAAVELACPLDHGSQR